MLLPGSSPLPYACVILPLCTELRSPGPVPTQALLDQGLMPMTLCSDVCSPSFVHIVHMPHVLNIRLYWLRSLYLSNIPFFTIGHRYKDSDNYLDQLNN